MGNAQANLTRLAAREITDITTSTVLSQISSSATTCIAGNYATINVGGPACGGVPTNVTDTPITVSQKASTTCTLSSGSTATVTSQTATQIANSIDQLSKQQGSSTQEWLALAVSIQQNNISSSTDIINMIRRDLSALQSSICTSQFVSTNNFQTTLCGDFRGSPITITQDATTLGIASCINKMVATILSTDSVLNGIVQRTDQTALSQQMGVGSVFGGLGTLLYVIVGVIVLIIIAVVIYYIVRSQQSK